MDSNMLKQAINLAGGPQYIIGFVYDNAGRTLFIDEDFRMDMIKDEFLVIPEEDISGIEVLAYKPIETIQTVISIKNLEDKKRIDKHYFRN